MLWHGIDSGSNKLLDGTSSSRLPFVFRWFKRLCGHADDRQSRRKQTMRNRVGKVMCTVPLVLCSNADWAILMRSCIDTY